MKGLYIHFIAFVVAFSLLSRGLNANEERLNSDRNATNHFNFVRKVDVGFSFGVGGSSRPRPSHYYEKRYYSREYQRPPVGPYRLRKRYFNHYNYPDYWYHYPGDRYYYYDEYYYPESPGYEESSIQFYFDVR